MEYFVENLSDIGNADEPYWSDNSINDKYCILSGSDSDIPEGNWGKTSNDSVENNVPDIMQNKKKKGSCDNKDDWANTSEHSPEIPVISFGIDISLPDDSIPNITFARRALPIHYDSNKSLRKSKS